MRKRGTLRYTWIIVYSWREGGARPGRHSTHQAGSDGAFRGYRPFWQSPDARRIDVRRSALDPSGDVMVRETGQRSSLNLVVAADVSLSLRPDPSRSALDGIVALAEAALRSTSRAGDGFGLLAFDRAVRDDISLRPTRSGVAAREAVSRLARLKQDGTDAAGIALLAERLPARRCLVLLVSDFLMPLELVERALAALARHDVVPVVLEVDTLESVPRRGLLRLADAENGRTRLLLMRPDLHRRWVAADVLRRHQLDLLFLRFGRAAFQASGALDVQALSQHLAGG